jgi:hypothetical protein
MRVFKKKNKISLNFKTYLWIFDEEIRQFPSEGKILIPKISLIRANASHGKS